MIQRRLRLADLSFDGGELREVEASDNDILGRRYQFGRAVSSLQRLGLLSQSGINKREEAFGIRLLPRLSQERLQFLLSLQECFTRRTCFTLERERLSA